MNFGALEPELLADREKYADTCVAVSDEVAIFANEGGHFWAYNRETQKFFGKYSDEKDEFHKNSITCIHIHPLRPEYVVLGFQGGQIVLVDLTDYDKNMHIKSRKIIKDHHKGSPLVSVKFCDWIKEREGTDDKSAPSKADPQAWMIASIDLMGRVVITTVTKWGLGILNTNKFVILDPTKQNLDMQINFDLDKYQVMQPRFHDKIFP